MDEQPISKHGGTKNSVVNKQTVNVAGVGDRKIAPLTKRIVARIIDTLILIPAHLLAVVVAVTSYGLGASWLETVESSIQAGSTDIMSLTPPPHVASDLWIFSIIWLIVSGLVSEVWITSALGGTPGKLLLGLRVVSVQDGGRISPNDSFNRWIAASLPKMLNNPLIELLGYVVWGSALLDREQYRGWHDKIARSIVVNWAK